MKHEIATILRESSHAILKITTRDRTSSIAREQPYLKSVDQIKGFSDSEKQTVRNILSDSFENGKGMRGTSTSLQEAFPDMEKKRAEIIARTGHTEVNNLAQAQKYKEKGFQSFTVVSTSEACDDCVDTYDGVVFSIDDTDMLPPLHPHCMCVAVFHEETPGEYAEQNGYDVYDGSVDTPEIDYTESTADSQVIQDLQELKDTIDQVNSLTNDQLYSFLESSLADVFTTSIDEVVISDAVAGVDSFLNDPVLMLEREPLKAKVLVELLRRLHIIA